MVVRESSLSKERIRRGRHEISGGLNRKEAASGAVARFGVVVVELIATFPAMTSTLGRVQVQAAQLTCDSTPSTKENA